MLFTSESVTEGHPDKIADQIADAVLDAILIQDPNARVACEVFTKTGMVLVGGEITTHAWVDIDEITREVVKDIGYNSSDMGFDWESCAVITSIGKQSPDIAMGVDIQENHEQGAGDQGIMFGYATDETQNYMPTPIAYAHLLSQQLSTVRKNKKLSWLRPDGKTQVTLQYENNEPVRVDTIVISCQHHPDIKLSDIQEAIREEVIKPIIPSDFLDKNTKYHINPTGRFVIGGPLGDSGLTGRKIIVDTYGSMARHGGGSFSGKDPSKVDRSAAYAARYVAKNIVAAKLARRCEIQISYAIGIAEPIAINVNTFGTNTISENKIVELIREHFDLRPRGIITMLDLLRPIYRATANYGHFGRMHKDFTWEKTDKIELLNPKG